MKYALERIPPHWQLFCQFHPYADGTLLDDRTSGTDEQLDFILKTMKERHDLDLQAVERLSQNRSRKYRQHRKILKEKFALIQFYITDDDFAFTTAATKDDIGWVQRNSSEDDWNCLWALANGETYKDIAASMKMRIGTLKAKVSRCRQRLFILALTS